MSHHLSYSIGFVLILTFIASNVSNAGADLRSDLKDFAALVPRRRIGYIAARYFIFDPQFRQALQFIRSKQFTATWQEIRVTPEFMAIVDYVAKQGSGFDVARLIDKLTNRLSVFQISRTVPVKMMLQRDLSTFLREVVNSLPRGRVANLMTTKVNENGDFAKFYRALRRTEFKELVMQARHSSSLSEALGRLQKNYINVDELLQLVFDILSWGPKV